MLMVRFLLAHTSLEPRPSTGDCHAFATLIGITQGESQPPAFYCLSVPMSTKMIQKLRNIDYEMRVKECGLTILETRRLREDQIELFKILNGFENIERNIFFTVKEERRTRGHGVTLAKKQCRLNIRKL